MHVTEYSISLLVVNRKQLIAVKRVYELKAVFIRGRIGLYGLLVQIVTDTLFFTPLDSIVFPLAQSRWLQK